MSNNIGHPSSVADGRVKLGKEGQLALLAARLGNGGAGKGGNKRLVISKQSERTAIKKVTVVEEQCCGSRSRSGRIWTFFSDPVKFSGSGSGSSSGSDHKKSYNKK